MPNLRIIHNNAADRATLAGSSSVGALVPANLKSDLKSVVWRSATAAAGATPTARLDASWLTAETIAAVALAYCRLTAQALMRVRGTNEASTTNFAKGSESLSAAAGWSGASVSVSGSVTYKGVVPYAVVAKTTTTANENRAMTIGAVTQNSTYTLTAALRAGTVGANSVALGIYDTGAAGWGPNANVTSAILEGPGIVTQASGGLINVTGLSASVDTLVKITRTFSVAGTMAILVYPGNSGSTTSGQNVYITRLQLESGAVPTSYYPAPTAAAVRPLGHMDAWQSYDLDSGWINPCPASEVTPATMGANGYAYGEGTHARAWLAAPAAVRALRVEISDPGNPGGYIEVARLVCGNYWEPEFNPDYGASVQPVDSSTNFRNGAGDLMSDVGTRSDKLSLSMSWLKPADRAALLRILRGNGITRPAFVSLFPNHSDPLLEQDHQVFGKLVETPAMSLPSYNIAAATLQIESV